MYLLLHVPVPLLLPLPEWGRRAQDGHLVQLEELLTQAVLQVLVQLATGRQFVKQVRSQKTSQNVQYGLKKDTCQMKNYPQNELYMYVSKQFLITDYKMI